MPHAGTGGGSEPPLTLGNQGFRQKATMTGGSPSGAQRQAVHEPPDSINQRLLRQQKASIQGVKHAASSWAGRAPVTRSRLDRDPLPRSLQQDFVHTLVLGPELRSVVVGLERKEQTPSIQKNAEHFYHRPGLAARSEYVLQTSSKPLPEPVVGDSLSGSSLSARRSLAHSAGCSRLLQQRHPLSGRRPPIAAQTAF